MIIIIYAISTWLAISIFVNTLTLSHFIAAGKLDVGVVSEQVDAIAPIECMIVRVSAQATVAKALS
jgi:hypothetical protein